MNKKKERGKEFFMMITAVLRSQKVIQLVLQTKKEIKKKAGMADENYGAKVNCEDG